MATYADRLTRAWETPSNLYGWLATVDHKRIGLRYLATAYGFFILAGLSALLMRAQLARPLNTLVDPETYNQLFTMHGTTMIFLVATPLLSGFGNYLLPLMLGSRDMAFPRLNAFGYWVFLLSGLFMWSSFLVGMAPNAGWFNYVPLSTRLFSPGLNIDFWALGLSFLGIASTAGAINFIVTILRMRAPGMSINRLPLFAWAILVTSFAIVFAIPSLTAANLLLELERMFGLHFYDVAGGGSPLLWQHLFWVFGHPDVYIILLPAVGIVSSIVPTFARRPIAGYAFMALATVATGIIGFGVWVHHMFAVGLSPLALTFFSVASLMITLASSVQIFGWLATLLDGRPVVSTALLFVGGFLALFVVGGVTGVMFAVVPFDWQVTDTYFVVAHFHYVLVGGFLFPAFAGFYYWLPKMTGRLLDERLGRWNFWLMFIGFNLTFFPMHIMGLLGMPRRVYTYEPNLGWDGLNLLATCGAVILAVGILVFLWNVLASRRGGPAAGDNPWQASTLEWATDSPPPPYNFRTLPVVHSRDPLWEPGSPANAAASGEWRDPTNPLHHETLASDVLWAQPNAILTMAHDSLWPLGLALGLLVVFVGLLLQLLLLALAGLLVVTAAAIGWLWPNDEAEAEAE